MIPQYRTLNWVGVLLFGGMIALVLRAVITYLRRWGWLPTFVGIHAEVAKGIEKTPGVCGGDARIAGTRIPVWRLVEIRDLGATDAELLRDFPNLRKEDLTNAWSYAKAHEEEIRAEIHANEVA